MLVGCKNCGGYFTTQELERLKPPVHPWGLTHVGERMRAQNVARGANLPCPKCGQNTLSTAQVPPSQ